MRLLLVALTNASGSAVAAGAGRDRRSALRRTPASRGGFTLRQLTLSRRLGRSVEHAAQNAGKADAGRRTYLQLFTIPWFHLRSGEGLKPHHVRSRHPDIGRRAHQQGGRVSTLGPLHRAVVELVVDPRQRATADMGRDSSELAGARPRQLTELQHRHHGQTQQAAPRSPNDTMWTNPRTERASRTPDIAGDNAPRAGNLCGPSRCKWALQLS